MTKIQKWKLLEEKDISPSKWLPLFQHKIELPSGKVVDDYFVTKFGDVAMVMAITKNREVFFVRQYRHGVQEILLEFPAGRIEKRSPEQAANDELREELGVEATELKPLGSIYVAPSKDSTITHGFLAEDVEVKFEQDLDDTEEIEAVLVPIDKIDSMIISGEIAAADTTALIARAKLLYPEIFSNR